MKTIENMCYNITREGNVTKCTLTASTFYIISLLAPRITHVYIDLIKEILSVHSTELMLFYKELRHTGFNLDFPYITIDTSIRLYKYDEDNPKLAEKIVKRKSFGIACYKVMTAINRVLEHRKHETEKLENIAIKLQIMSRYGK